MKKGGLLGRLARIIAQWLRSLARRLDHVGGPAPVPRTVLQALAERFPGAPEHWLADVARHMLATGETLPVADGPTSPVEHPPTYPARAPSQSTVGQQLPPRRTRPALRLIGAEARRQPAAESAEGPSRRRRAPLRWLAATPSEISTQTYPDAPVTERRSADLPGAFHDRKPRLSDWTLLSRKARRLTNIAAPEDRIPPDGAPAAPIHQPAAHDPFVTNHARAREQEVVFSNPAADAAHESRQSHPPIHQPRAPLEFVATRSMPRASPVFPETSRARDAAGWPPLTDEYWPALPPHEQTIPDAPSAAAALTDLVREQMVGQWSE